MLSKQRSRLSDELIANIRKKVVEGLEKLDKSYYDADDLEKNVLSSDLLIVMFATQYLDDHGIKKVEKSHEDDSKLLDKISTAIVDALTWRKSVGVTHLTLNDFPSEYHSQGYFKIGLSGQENEKVTIVQDFGRHRKLNGLLNKIEMIYYFVYTERVTLEHFRAGKEISILFDHVNFSLGNVDPSFMLEFFSLASTYYPSIYTRLVAFEVPWYVKPVVTMARAILPSRITSIFTVEDRKSLPQLMQPSEIPVWMAGENKCNLLTVSPSGTFAEISRRYNVSEADVKRLEAFFKNHAKDDAAFQKHK